MKSHQSLVGLFSHQLTDQAKRKPEKKAKVYDNDLAWVFVSDDMKQIKAVRTYKTLFLLQKQTIYFTPNTFYRNDLRRKDTLRWLNAFTIDIDVKNGQNEALTLPELFDRINAAGLPQPTQIVQTPSGGYHVYFYFAMSKRATMPVIDLYEDVARAMAKEIGGDVQAIGAERWFRMPTEKNICFTSNERTTFEHFYDWFCINREEMTSFQGVKHVGTYDLLQHPAIVSLLEGVEEGKRDNTCYTLALLFKSLNWTNSQTEARLQEWNAHLDKPLPAHVVSIKVKSAFRSLSKKGASASWIRYLSGMDFHYQQITTAKPREERQRSHYEEWEADLLAFLKTQDNKSIQGTQKEIASQLGMSCSTFKIVIKRLKDRGEITIEVNGRGRGSTTLIVLKPSKESSLSNKVVEMSAANRLELSYDKEDRFASLRSKQERTKDTMEDSVVLKEPVSFTSIDRVVGWDAPGLRSLLASLPKPLQVSLSSFDSMYSSTLLRAYYLLGLYDLIQEFGVSLDISFLELWFAGEFDCSIKDYRCFYEKFREDYIAYSLLSTSVYLEQGS